MSMANKRKFCEPCLFVETEIEAVGFCPTCVECLCSRCVIDHKKTKVTRNHKVHHDSIPENVDLIREMNELLACPVHKEMMISYRCNDHFQFICTMCRVDTHVNCAHVFDITKSEALDRDLQCIQENIKELKLLTAFLKDKREKNRKILYQNRTDILREQKDIVDKAINDLEEIKKNFAEKADKWMKEAMSNVDDDIEHMEIMEQWITKREGIVEAAKKFGDSVMSKVFGHFLLDSIIHQKNFVEADNKIENYKLLFEKNDDCIKVSSLGTFSILYDEGNENKYKSDDLEKTSDEITDTEMYSLNVFYTNVNTAAHCLPTVWESFFSHKREISVSVHTDKHYSSICGITVLPDGGLVVIDNRNLNIKLLSSDYTLLDAVRLPCRPIRICSMGNNVVAVSFYRLKRINRYLVKGNALLYDGGFPTSLFNHGIGFDGNEIVTLMSDKEFDCSNNAKNDTIVVQYRNPFDGMVSDMIFDFKVEGTSVWSLALNNTQALQLTQDRRMVIAEKNRVLCFDLCVEEPFSRTFAIENDFFVGKREEFKDKIENIAIESESIFVCTSSGRVLQLSASDFSNNRTIIADPGESYSAIAVDEVNERLFLGCIKKDEIIVYEA